MGLNVVLSGPYRHRGDWIWSHGFERAARRGAIDLMTVPNAVNDRIEIIQLRLVSLFVLPTIM